VGARLAQHIYALWRRQRDLALALTRLFPVRCTTLHIFLAAALAARQSAMNTTTVGWVPEPAGRGTMSLLWSCLSTLFICVTAPKG